MQHLYSDLDGWATVNVVDLSPFFKKPLFIIQGVEVLPKNRGQGIARNLMKRVLDDADREGVTLVLSVVGPHDPHDRFQNGLLHDELYAWYCRLGFEPWDTGEDPDAMIRHPRNAGKCLTDVPEHGESLP